MLASFFPPLFFSLACVLECTSEAIRLKAGDIYLAAAAFFCMSRCCCCTLAVPTQTQFYFSFFSLSVFFPKEVRIKRRAGSSLLGWSCRSFFPYSPLLNLSFFVLSAPLRPNFDFYLNLSQHSIDKGRENRGNVHVSSPK